MNHLSVKILVIVVVSLFLLFQANPQKGYSMETEENKASENNTPLYVSLQSLDNNSIVRYNTSVTFRFSYVRPQNDLLLGNKECRYLIIKLPDDTLLRTAKLEDNQSYATRYFFYSLKPLEEIQTLTLTPNICPYTIKVYPMTGYIMNRKPRDTTDSQPYVYPFHSRYGALESLPSIQVTISPRRLLKPGLRGVRLTHSPESVCENMRLLYRYER